MYKVVVHGADSCNSCIKVQNLLTRHKVPFVYDDLNNSPNSANYARIPVTEIVSFDKSIEKWVGELSSRDIDVIKTYMKFNQNFN